jgi:hypothetical protein
LGIMQENQFLSQFINGRDPVIHFEYVAPSI